MRVDRFEENDMDELTQDFREAFEGNEYFPFVSPEAFTFRSMGEVISIIGIVQFHKGVYMAWAFQSHSLTYVGRLYARVVRHLIEQLLEQYKMKKMVILIAGNEPKDERWMRFLGFTYSFEMPDMCEDGSPLYGYIRKGECHG
jgi:hypothetical protein